jgi:hypothetical protein
MEISMFNILPVFLSNFILVILWIVLAVMALVQLRRLPLPEIARALWVLLIVAIPFGGAIAFWIVSPGSNVS